MLEQLAKEINEKGGDAFCNSWRYGRPKGSAGCLNKTIKHFGRLDVVVSNAGIIDRATTLDMTLDNWHHVLNVNLTGPMCSLPPLYPTLRSAKRKDNFISSIGAKTVNTNASPAYGCSRRR
jgi:NAD(P)-dependent dehydrogenase (short-subunit alcohol dehydrogenase family)